MAFGDELPVGGSSAGEPSPMDGGRQGANPLVDSAYRAGSCIGLLELMDVPQRARFKHVLVSRALTEVDAALSEVLSFGAMDEEGDVSYLAQIRSHLAATQRWLAEHADPAWSTFPLNLARLYLGPVPASRIHDAAMNLAAAAMTDDLVDVLFWTVNAAQFRRYSPGPIPDPGEHRWQLEIAWAVHQGKEPPLPDAPPENPL